MNRDLNSPFVPPSAADLARQAKIWAWYVRGHLCLTVLWALMMLRVIPEPADRLLDGIFEFSMYGVFVGPILNIVLISRAARYGGAFVMLAIAESCLSAGAFWILLPAVQ